MQSLLGRHAGMCRQPEGLAPAQQEAPEVSSLVKGSGRSWAILGFAQHTGSSTSGSTPMSGVTMFEQHHDGMQQGLSVGMHRIYI